MIRLERLLAERTTHSRREARNLVRRGHVRVQGEVVRDPSARVAPTARVELDGRLVSEPPELVIVHKPVGVVTTTGDEWGRPDLQGLVGELLALGLHPVGRLDADTDGLLPLCRHGAWTQRLLHPRHGVEKVYVAAVEGTPGPDLAGRLADGVETSDGVFSAELLEVDGSCLTVAVTEGKHRMVRRMLANAGHPVESLRRVRFGELELGDLPAGAWRPATEAELAWVRGLQG